MTHEISVLGRKITRNHIIWGLLGLVMLFGLGLRLFHLGSVSFTFDEVHTLDSARIGPLGFVQRAWSSSEIHPPLYYMLLNLWARLGSSEFVVRLFPLMLSVASILSIFLLAKYLYDEKIGLVSAFVLAISPAHIYFSQENRMYSLAILVGLISLYSFVRALRKNKIIWWLSYTVTAVLGVYTHYYFLFLLVAEGFYFVLTFSRHKHLVKKAVLCNVAWFILFSPWVVILFHQTRLVAQFNSQTGYQPSVDPLAIPVLFKHFAFGETLSGLSIPLVLGMLAILPPFIMGIPAYEGRRIDWKPDNSTLLLLMFLFVPILAAYMLSLSSSTTGITFRYLLLFSPAFLILIARGLVKLKSIYLSFVFAAIIVGVSFLSLNNYYFDQKYIKSNYKEIVQYIESNSSVGDMIITSPNWLALPVKYYYGGNLPIKGIPVDFAENNYVANNGILTDENIGNLDALIEKRDRIWLILSRGDVFDPDKLIGAELNRTGYDLMQEKKFSSGDELVLYGKDFTFAPPAS